MAYIIYIAYEMAFSGNRLKQTKHNHNKHKHININIKESYNTECLRICYNFLMFQLNLYGKQKHSEIPAGSIFWFCFSFIYN